MRSEAYKNISELITTSLCSQKNVPWLLLIANVVSFIVFSIAAFTKNEDYLFYGLDGNYMVLLAGKEQLWRGLELGFSNNILQSLGNVWFPLNSSLLPGFKIGALMEVYYQASIVAYVIFSLELFTLGIALGRIIGIGWGGTVIGAWILPLLFMPYVGEPFAYHSMMLVPHESTMMLLTTLIVWIITQIGRSDFRHSLILLALAILAILYLSLAMPGAIILMAPFLVMVAATCTIWAGSLRERALKVTMAIIGIAALLASGMPSYFLGLIQYTAASFYPHELENTRMNYSFASIFFHGGIGAILFTLGCSGAVLQLAIGTQRQRSLAIGVLLAAAFLLTLGILFAHVDFWRGPSPLYFEKVIFPFYVVYVTSLIEYFATKSLARIEMSVVSRALLVATATLPWLLFLYHRPSNPARELFPTPPPKTKIVELLEKEIAVRPGQPFRGRVATLTGQKLPDKMSWADIEYRDYLMRNNYGTEHRSIGFWYYDIPTLHEYNSFITPAFFKFTKEFFGREGDRQVRSVMTLRQPNIRWLAAIGVRFVVTDTPINGAAVLVTLPLGQFGDLYLQELNSPNLGQYSPQKSIFSRSVNETLKILAEESFDPKKELVSDVRLPSNLIHATEVEMTFYRRSTRVTAKSDGQSVLILPLEFSHCYKVINGGNSVSPIIFRANLLLTGVLFENNLDVTLSYFTGPFNNNKCRLDDKASFGLLSK